MVFLFQNLVLDLLSLNLPRLLLTQESASLSRSRQTSINGLDGDDLDDDQMMILMMMEGQHKE